MGHLSLLQTGNSSGVRRFAISSMLYTLRPTPYALRSKPYVLSSTPYALCPTPFLYALSS